MDDKNLVKSFWEDAACGENLYLAGFTREDYSQHSETRYRLEPEILDFLQPETFRGKKTLEVGVGLGADHATLARHGAVLFGIDLTERAVLHTRNRFKLMELSSTLQVADAEQLPFSDGSFDAVYSWGVIHHSPGTRRCVEEIHRVLKAGGVAKVMIYHKYSLVGFMLWLRYALFAFKPLRSLSYIYDKYLESPGTKAYSHAEARELFREFEVLSMKSPLTHGDLLTSDAGQRHRGLMLTVAKRIWPRWFFRRVMPKFGLSLMIEAVKPIR